MIIVETDREGFETNKLSGKLGIRASNTTELVFNNVRVPSQNLVGELGNGFMQAMHLFNLNRIGVAARFCTRLYGPEKIQTMLRLAGFGKIKIRKNFVTHQEELDYGLVTNRMIAVGLKR